MVSGICRTVIFLAAFAASVPALAETIVLSRSSASVLGSGAEQVLRVAYGRAGIPLRVVQMPRQRSLVATVAGETDGEVIRDAEEINRHPEFRRLEPPVAYNEIAAFVRKESSIQELDDLQQYSVVYLNGINAHRELAATARVAVPVETPDQLLKVLDSGRVDVALINPLGARVRLASGAYQNVHPDGFVLRSEALFHYLHQDQAGIAENIETALQEMAENGEIDRAFGDGVVEFLNSREP